MRALPESIVNFVRPLYQDLDGSSRFDEVERVAMIAQRLHHPGTDRDSRLFQLTLLFQGLGSWLRKIGNLSRVILATGDCVAEEELREVAASLRRLDAPETDAEKALAAAQLIDQAGLRGLAARFAAARREGATAEEVVSGILEERPLIPAWIPEAARRWVESRYANRSAFCRQFLTEMTLSDAEEIMEGRATGVAQQSSSSNRSL